MNRYMLVDFEKNNLYSLSKVDINFRENETQTSSVSCIDKDDLVDELCKCLEELAPKETVNHVYDNGKAMLGTTEDMLLMISEGIDSGGCDDLEFSERLYNDLKYIPLDAIVVIHYDNVFDYTIEVFNRKDICM